MSNIRIEAIGKDISIIPKEIVMRDQTPETIYDPEFNIIVNLHPSDGTHWVLVIRREGGKIYYFDSFGVETPPLFLKQYTDLGSNERLQKFDESFCGANCLFLIYLIDIGFRIKNALNILVNQCEYQGMSDGRLCLRCKGRFKVEVNDKDEVNGNVNDNQGTCIADDNGNVNGNDNGKGNDNGNGNANDNVNANDNTIANDITIASDNVNDNGNVNVDDNDNVNDIDSEKLPRVKSLSPLTHSSQGKASLVSPTKDFTPYTGEETDLLIDVNRSPQS